MKQRILTVALVLCLCIFSRSVAYAYQGEDDLEESFTEESAGDSTIPTPTEVYEAMTALKDQDMYKEGAAWTNYEPYPDSEGKDYMWNGGPLDGTNISAAGCAAFAFILSDAAFGSLPARMYTGDEFSFEDIKAGDILRVNNDSHTVIVLEVSDTGVVIAEGNYNGTVHWGRSMTKEEVMSITSHYITRYPEGYVLPDDPAANDIIGSGTLDGGLTWNLTKVGTLTISGSGAMPDFDSAGDQPWSDNGSTIRKVVIENGVTSIGSCAFWGCGVLSAEISSSVTVIGNSSFRSSPVISVIIPSSVKTIGDSAFRECENLGSVTVSEGVEIIEQNAFRACMSLASITLPASIGEVGDGAFFECVEMKNVAFTPGSKQVKMGDNLFTQCYKLESVTLPQRIDCIGKGMFQNCLMLTEVEIPQGAGSIEEAAFASCYILTDVTIPDSVTTIGTSAFSACSSLADIYFTGTEAQWNSISKIGDTVSAVANATIHYNYIPTSPEPGDGDDGNTGDDSGSDDDNNTSDDSGNDNDDDSNTGSNIGGDQSGNTSSGDNSGSSSSENAGSNAVSGSNAAKRSFMASSAINSDIRAVMETWKPTTFDEKKRYACRGKEAVQCILAEDNAYRIDIENAVQGPLCFKSFEAVLGDYTIGRTYNVYALSDTIYSMDKEIQFTIKIPSDIYKKDREYKMICVTKGGQPFVYEDLDSSPETITIKTNKFYAYALVYRQRTD